MNKLDYVKLTYSLMVIILINEALELLLMSYLVILGLLTSVVSTKSTQLNVSHNISLLISLLGFFPH